MLLGLFTLILPPFEVEGLVLDGLFVLVFPVLEEEGLLAIGLLALLFLFEVEVLLEEVFLVLFTS